MIGIKACISHANRLLIADGTGFSAPKPDPEKRVDSLDIFRGLTVALMILVGMAIPLTFKRISSRDHAVKKMIVRTLKLLFWGIMLQGGFSHAPDKLSYGVDMKKIRWSGILQRIAFAYLVMALMEILKKKRHAKDLPPGWLSIFKLYASQWLMGACILVIYLAVIYGMYVPHWQFTVNDEESSDYGKAFTVECGVRGKLDPACNAVGYIDRKILGINHLHQQPAWKRSEACTETITYEAPFQTSAPTWCNAPFEPEGILSSISSVLSTIIGVHFGHVLVHLKDDTARLKHWTVMGLSLLISGLVLHFTHAMPLNKQLYTFSYVCVTSGAAALVFSAIYVLGQKARVPVFHSFRPILCYIVVNFLRLEDDATEAYSTRSRLYCRFILFDV
ncbi:hypothetical protein OIU78_021293 [Salix suchowensis]|nr:hypothetical protein OIU78_021293 [Salix suchowensis]